MKELLLIRHAKSSWDNTDLVDFDRPLNERGRSDAPIMVERLLKRKIKVDAFVSSPAKRAKKTAQLFCEIFEKKENKLVLVDQLYHASSENFYHVITGLDNKHHSVCIFSHNPGITDFVNTLFPDIRIDNIPTCGIFALKADTKKWEDFRTAPKEFLFFDFPKNSNFNK